MNIQQLNQNGQHFWVFFVTAFVALMVTGGFWFCSKSAHKAMEWYREREAISRANSKNKEKREYGLLLRMAMLVWLVRNGHKPWMWRSGAWIAIPMNSNVRSGYTACDFVWTHSQNARHQRHMFDTSTLDNETSWSPLRG